MLGVGGVNALEASAALGADCCNSAWLNVIVAKFPSLLIVTFVAPTRSDHSILAILYPSTGALVVRYFLKL